jgi:hypothetical protein
MSSGLFTMSLPKMFNNGSKEGIFPVFGSLLPKLSRLVLKKIQYFFYFFILKNQINSLLQVRSAIGVHLFFGAKHNILNFLRQVVRIKKIYVLFLRSKLAISFKIITEFQELL